MKKLSHNFYSKIFNFIAEKRIKDHDVDLNFIHTHLLVMFTSGILMWGYAFLAYFCIDSPTPAIVGFSCAAIHNLSPLLYRWCNSVEVNSSVLLGAGVIHQGCFTYFTGGVHSNILIWYGIIPMLAGIMAGKRLAIKWTGVVLVIASGYLASFLLDFETPNLITAKGQVVSQVMMIYGWVILSLVIIYGFIYIRDLARIQLESKTEKVNSLLRLLCHDLSGPLSVLSTSVEIVDVVSEERRLLIKEKMKTSTKGMVDMIKNVKSLYMVDRIEPDFFKQPVNIKQAFLYVELLLEEKLIEKNITMIKEILVDDNILAEEISFKNQVLLNIVSNAIKFSPRDSQIHVQAFPLDSDKISISIKDNGIGIPKDLKSKIFDPFAHKRRGGTDGEIGIGFGLSIVKSFMENYDGEVLVDSCTEKESGTTFTLNLKKA